MISDVNCFDVSKQSLFDSKHVECIQIDVHSIYLTANEAHILQMDFLSSHTEHTHFLLKNSFFIIY